MPGAAHETLVEFLREFPSWLDALLRALGMPPLPTGVRAVDTSVRVVDPSAVQPDVLLFEPERRAWTAVEVQRDDDPAKARRWPLMIAALQNQYDSPGDLLVITHSRAVARWAHSVARSVGPMGTRLSLVPRVVCLTHDIADALLARAKAELALFAAWAVHTHRSERAARVMLRAAALGNELSDTSLRGALTRAMINMVNQDLRKRLKEKVMDFSKIPEGPLMRDVRLELERILRPDVLRDLARELRPEVTQHLAAELRPEVTQHLAAELRPEVTQHLAAELRPEVTQHLAAELRPEVTQHLAAELRPEVTQHLAAELRPEVTQHLAAELRPEVTQHLAAELRPEVEERLRTELRPEIERQEIARLIEERRRAEALNSERRGEALALLRVIERRGLSIDEARRARVVGCTDAAQLAEWIERAVSATTLEEVFDDAG